MGNFFCCPEEEQRRDGYDYFDLNASDPSGRLGTLGIGYGGRPTGWAEAGHFTDQFLLKRQIGKGSTASCHVCAAKSNNKEYAVKILSKKKIKMMYSNLMPQFRLEVDILRALEHPHIIRLHSVFEDKQNLFVVTELARGGELFDYLVSRPNQVLSEASVSFLIRQVIHAVAEMHKYGIIHRDLKLENILLAKKPKDTGSDADFKSIQLKIIDFGLAKMFDEEIRQGDNASNNKNNAAPGPNGNTGGFTALNANQTAKTFFGTVGYIAPEMMQRKQYTNAVDVWAIGVIAYVLLCGVFPFDDKSRELDYKLRYPAWVSELSESAKDLLEKLLAVDPKRRLTAQQALYHPWVSGQTASPRTLLSSPGYFSSLFSPMPGTASSGGKPTKTPGSTMMILDSLDEEESISPLALNEEPSVDNNEVFLS